MSSYPTPYPKHINKILIIAESFQSLTQRLYVELCEKNYDVTIEFDVNKEVLIDAVKLFEPDLIIASYLKSAIPEEIFLNTLCLIVHPGIKGDRGPSSLDYAILNKEKVWGTTIIQVDYEWDTGDIWSSFEFPMRFAKKSSLYRQEVTESAIRGIFDSFDKIQNGILPQKLDYSNPDIKGKWNPYLKQELRKINWEKDTTETILRKIYASDGNPGVMEEFNNKFIYLFNAYPEEELHKEFKNKRPGEWIAKRDHAMCRKTIDGAIWITHLKEKDIFKLPASYVLSEVYESLPEIKVSYKKCNYQTYQEIYYTIQDNIGFLYFEFYNGAMSTEQCIRLKEAYVELKKQDVRLIVLMGGEDFWSNGIHLNIIEYAESPSWESWKNINAMDDLCEEIINDLDHITVAVLRGNAGAGGVFFALSCDFVFAKKGIILNPHYKSMGNLYGSEYWTYLLPKRISETHIKELINNRLPIGTNYAKKIGLIDDELDSKNFFNELYIKLKNLKNNEYFFSYLEYKREKRNNDETIKPLDQYRKEELENMHRNFFGFDPSYHIARYYFVHKIKNFRTPLYLAKHRRLNYKI